MARDGDIVALVSLKLFHVFFTDLITIPITTDGTAAGHRQSFLLFPLDRTLFICVII